MGVPGPPGISPPGSDANYVHDHPVPSATWDITHNLNKYPSITIVDTSDTSLEGKIEYLDLDTVRLTFNSAFAGKAVFN